MYVSVAEAQGQLLEFVRRAEAGEEVLLTHEGRTIGRIGALNSTRDLGQRPQTAEERLKIIQSVVAKFPPMDDGGPGAARSRNFLYGEEGLPA